jgi:hypothetical protein
MHKIDDDDSLIFFSDQRNLHNLHVSPHNIIKGFNKC